MFITGPNSRSFVLVGATFTAVLLATLVISSPLDGVLRWFVVLLGAIAASASANKIKRHHDTSAALPNLDATEASRLAAILNTVVDGIITIDSQGSIRSFNPAAQRIFGCGEEEVIGQNVRMLMPEPDRSGHDGYLANYAGGGAAKIIGIGREVIGLRSDGSLFPLDLAVSKVFSDADEADQLYVGIVRDISERKLAEQALAESEAALALSNAQNESILRAVGDGILAIDVEGRVAAINPAAAHMLRMSMEDALGKRTLELGSLTKADGSPYGDHEHIATKVIEQGLEIQVEDDLLTRADGTTIVIDRIVTPLHNSQDSATVGIVMTMRDSTERARMDRAKAEFLAMTSHELKTPVTAIHAAVGLVVSGALGALPEKADALLRTASSNSDRLLKLVNEIVELEGLNMGISQKLIEPKDTRGLLEDVASGLEALAGTSGIALRVEDESVITDMDEEGITRILVNLVGNAIKFSPAGAEVVLASRVTCDEVEFSVTDSGVGIPPELAAQIFEPFRQVRRSDSSELGGSGLGLAICKGIVEQHSGRIWVESAPGQGSTFKFTLPLTRA